MGDFITESANSLIEAGIFEKATETRNSLSPSISQPFCKIRMFLEMLKLLGMEDLAVFENIRMFEIEGEAKN